MYLFAGSPKAKYLKDGPDLAGVNDGGHCTGHLSGESGDVDVGCRR